MMRLQNTETHIFHLHFPTNDDTMAQTIRNTELKVGDTIHFTRADEILVVISIIHSIENNRDYIKIYAIEYESGYDSEIYYHGGYIGAYMNDTLIIIDYDLGI